MVCDYGVEVTVPSTWQLVPPLSFKDYEHSSTAKFKSDLGVGVDKWVSQFGQRLIYFISSYWDIIFTEHTPVIKKSDGIFSPFFETHL